MNERGREGGRDGVKEKGREGGRDGERASYYDTNSRLY